MQIKVENITPYAIKGNNPHIGATIETVQVAEGKLVFIIEPMDEPIADQCLWRDRVGGKIFINNIDNPFSLAMQYDAIKPIIISETEKIEVNDDYLWTYTKPNKIITCSDEDEKIAIYSNNADKFSFKVLALPEQFSRNYIQEIVEGKIKDGDKILVECETIKYPSQGHGTKSMFCNYVKLDSSNRVRLHKVKEKMYTRDEVLSILQKLEDTKGWGRKDYIEEWFDQNVK